MQRNKCIAIIFIVLAIIAILYRLSGRKELLTNSSNNLQLSQNETSIIVFILTKLIIKFSDCGVTNNNTMSKHINNDCVKTSINNIKLRQEVANLLSESLESSDISIISKVITASDNKYGKTSLNPLYLPNDDVIIKPNTSSNAVLINRYNNLISNAIGYNMRENTIKKCILDAAQSISNKTRDRFTTDNLVNEIMNCTAIINEFKQTLNFISNIINDVLQTQKQEDKNSKQELKSETKAETRQEDKEDKEDKVHKENKQYLCPPCPTCPACPACPSIVSSVQQQETKQEIISENKQENKKDVSLIRESDKIDVAKLNEQVNKVDTQTKQNQGCTIL